MLPLNEQFQKLKANLEPGDAFATLITQRHNAVRDFIQNRHPTIIGTKLIGSVGRKTRIHPRPEDKFDIDILVIMDSFYSWLPTGSPSGVTPQRALDNLYRIVAQSDRYGAMTPQQAPPTITMTYADQMNVEVVPAYLDRIGASPGGTPHSPAGRAYWVPKNGAWELADYDYEAGYISTQNAASDGWLIPTIKMLKAIKRNYFPGMRSFHLDIMAATIVPICVASQKQSRLPISYPGLIRDFFGYVTEYYSSFTKIPGSHSPAVILMPAEIADVTDILVKIRTYVNGFIESPESKQIEGWKLLFGDPFPSV